MDKKHTIKLNQAPISWVLDEGRVSFFDIPAVMFWLNPSLLRMLQPLREEVGEELYRLIIAYQASLGTEEDYHQMVKELGSSFEEGFLAWGAAVSAAGWGHFEILEFDIIQHKAVVRVTNPWELQMLESQTDADAWGCPFLLGKIIGIFSYAMGETCWADEKNIIMGQDESSIELHIYASESTIEEELEKLRSMRRGARETQLLKEIKQRQQTEDSLRSLAENFTAISGTEFFAKVASHLARALEIDYIFIGELIEGESRVNVVGGYARGEPAMLPFVYDLADTPCEYIMEQSFLYYSTGIQTQFPKDTLLRDMDVDCYMGIPLFGKNNKLLGLIAGLDSKPAENLERAEILFKIFASRVAVEIERKHIEDKLKKSELQYRTLFESSADAIIILNNAGFIDCNQSALDMFGWTSFDNMSGHPSDFSPLLQPCGKNSGTLANEYIATACKNGSHQFEWMHKRMDGTVFPSEVLLTAMQLGESLVQATIRDITERKKKEESLRKLSSAIEQAGESIIITDKNGVIEYVNPAFTALSGYSAEEALGQTPRLLKSGNQDAAFYKDMWDTITSGKVWHGKVIDRKKDGSFYPTTLTISPIVDSSNDTKYTHFVGIQSDLTNLEELEHQFHQAQKMEAIGTLVGGIAHDFNNMLAGITGNLYLAKKKLPAQSDIVDKLNNVESLSFRAANMIQQLLTFARKDMVSMKAMPLTPFIKETLKFLRTSVPENITMHENICSEPLQVKGIAPKSIRY